MEEKVCQRPFNEIEIYENGDVFTCCPKYFKEENFFIGNLFDVNSFDEIWYSERAKKLRNDLLKGDYSSCKTELCHKEYNCSNVDLVECPHYPSRVRFSFDKICNYRCIFCRDRIEDNTDEQKISVLIDKIMKNNILKDAKLLTISTVGEFSVSKYSQNLIKEIVKNYPQIKFDILTNGSNFSKEFCEEMGFIDKIESIIVSVHSLKKDTYNKIVRSSDNSYDKVMDNLKYIFDLKRNEKIKDLSLVFVVTSLNYKEIPSFIEYAKKNGAYAQVWEYRKSNVDIDKQYIKYAVWSPYNKHYNDFCKIIKKIKEKYEYDCFIPEFFNDLKPLTWKEILKNKICKSK